MTLQDSIILFFPRGCSNAGAEQRPTLRLQRAGVIEIGRAFVVHKVRLITTPNRTITLHLRTDTAPDGRLQSAKSRGVPDRVCDGLGGAKQESRTVENG